MDNGTKGDDALQAIRDAGGDQWDGKCAACVADVGEHTCGEQPPPIPNNTTPIWELVIRCGSATTMQVAASLGRKGIGIDLNADYLPLARERVGGLFLESA